jgi:hypothetical protein
MLGGRLYLRAQREERLREARTLDIKAVSQSNDRKKRRPLSIVFPLLSWNF